MQNYYRYNIHLKREKSFNVNGQNFTDGSAVFYFVPLTLPLYKHARLSICLCGCICVVGYGTGFYIRHFGTTADW